MRGLAAQIERLVALGVADAIGLPHADFRRKLQALEAHFPAAPSEADDGADIDAGTADAVIVINTPSLLVRRMLPLVSRGDQVAIERLFPRQPEDFRPAPDLGIPEGEAYLLLGLDRGNETLNAVPAEMPARLASQRRSPLTVEEGVSVLLQWPWFLKPNHCFMMMGSRCGDRRVPALWLSGRQPKLGWCWEGNPHTWLGFASCLRRSPGVALSGPWRPDDALAAAPRQ